MLLPRRCAQARLALGRGTAALRSLPHARAATLAGACVVLVRTQGPINLGMIARLCGNLGIDDLRLVAPQCEVNCEDARKFSTHSRELLLHAHDVRRPRAGHRRYCALVVGSSARFRDGELGAGLVPTEVPGLLARRPAQRWALVFGNEADGLNDEELRCCQAWVHLASFGPNISYNLANACAIILYGIATARAPHRLPTSPRPPPAPMSRTSTATGTPPSNASSTTAAPTPERFAPQLRKFLGRLHLARHDVQVLRGACWRSSTTSPSASAKRWRRLTEEPRGRRTPQRRRIRARAPSAPTRPDAHDQEFDPELAQLGGRCWPQPAEEFAERRRRQRRLLQPRPVARAADHRAAARPPVRPGQRAAARTRVALAVG